MSKNLPENQAPEEEPPEASPNHQCNNQDEQQPKESTFTENYISDDSEEDDGDDDDNDRKQAVLMGPPVLEKSSEERCNGDCDKIDGEETSADGHIIGCCDEADGAERSATDNNTFMDPESHSACDQCTTDHEDSVNAEKSEDGSVEDNVLLMEEGRSLSGSLSSFLIIDGESEENPDWQPVDAVDLDDWEDVCID